MMRAVADYQAQLAALLPPGRAWPRDRDTTLGRLLWSFAGEFARVDGRSLALLEEADPLTTLELLPDWERVAGLPDDCRPIAETVRERQQTVAAKIAGIGGQSPAYLEWVAAAAGYEVTIAEFVPFSAGSAAGSECCDDRWRHAFVVEVAAVAEDNVFRAGSSAGDRLRNWGGADVECLVGRAAPAHAQPLFAYVLFEPEPMLWFDFLAD